MEGQPKMGDPIPDDHRDNRGQTIEFAKKQVRELASLKLLTSEQQEALEGYQNAILRLQEKDRAEQLEREQLKPLRSAANGVFRFLNTLEGWGAIQTESWVGIGEDIIEAKNQNDTERVLTGLNQWLKLSQENLDKKGFEESKPSGIFQRRAIKDIQEFLRILDEYKIKDIPIPWDKI